MREASPWKSIGLLNIVQELDKLESAGANPFNLLGLLDGIEIDPYVMDATARRRDDVVKASEVTHEQRLSSGTVGVEAAVGHWQPAAGLIAWIDDLVPEALQKF
jgi:hypothetical protein